MNQVVIVGRISSMNESFLEVCINRTSKNEFGEYKSDFIKCYVKDSLNNSLLEYCEVGDVIGVKGRLKHENPNDPVVIVAERLTFLSSKKNNQGE